MIKAVQSILNVPTEADIIVLNFAGENLENTCFSYAQ